MHAGIPPPLAPDPPEHSPSEQTPPRADTPPGPEPPRADTPPAPDPPEQTPPAPPEQTPPRKQTPAYGLRAAGTHPTGMHSCFLLERPLIS